MLDTITTTFILPDYIAHGLDSGLYERIGGVVRETHTKQIVAWLRDAAPTSEKALGHSLAPWIGATNLGISVLGLGISVMGFTLMSQKLKSLETQLQKLQSTVDKLNAKIDLSFYVNFLAALDLAANAFTMATFDNRRSSALQAVNRFLEVEHLYCNLFDDDIDRCGVVLDFYLATLALAYVSEIRCYLELGEYSTALRKLQDAQATLRSRTQRYVELVLTDNPAIYLHPDLKEQVDLRRLTQVYQWLGETHDENSVFEMHRDGFARLIRKSHSAWRAVPQSLLINIDDKRQFSHYLPNFLERAETAIETHQRFMGYGLEVEFLAHAEIPFSEWQRLAPAPSLESSGTGDGAKPDILVILLAQTVP